MSFGNTVDSKVVELSLENQDFESNAKQSLSTIDKLKASLDFSSVPDGLEDIGSSIKNINFNVLSRGIETAKVGFRSLDAIAYGALFRIGQKVSDVTQALITAVPNQIISGGKQRAMNIEQAKFQLKGLGVAWEDIVGDIDYAVTDTAYGLDQAAKVASQLVASSVQLGEPMKKALRGISGVAAMTNSSYDEIGHVFTTVAGQGRLMAEQLNSLASRGLNVAATMGKAMGKTEAEIRKMVSKGQIDFATFAEAMDDAFGEHATEANSTFTGVFSNIKANLSKIGELFAIPAYEGLRRVFNGMLPLIKDIRIELTPLANEFETVFLSICTGVQAAFDILHAAVKGDRRSMGQIIKERFFPDSKTVEKEGKKTVKSVEDIHDKALQVIRDHTKLAQFAQEGYDVQQIQDYVNAIWKLTGGTWNVTDAILAQVDVMLNLNETAEESEEAAEGAADGAENLADKYEDAYKGIDNTSLLMRGLINLMHGAMHMAYMLKQEFGTIFTVDSEAKVRGMAVSFMDLSTAFRDFSFKHAGNIADIVHGLYSVFKIWESVLLTVVNIIRGVFGAVWDVFGDDIMNLLGWLGRGVTRIQEWITESGILERVVNGITGAVHNAAETLHSWIEAFLAIPEVQTTIEKFRNAFKLTFGDFDSTLGSIGTGFSFFFQRIERAFKILNTTKDPAKFFEHIKLAFSGLWEYFKDQDWFQAFEDAFGSIGGIFDSLAESFNTWLEDLKVKMKGTLVGDILEFVTGGFDAIKEKIKSVFGIGGDSDEVTDAMEGMEKKAFSLGGVLEWLGDFLSDAISLITDKIPWGKVLKLTIIGGILWEVFKKIRDIYWTFSAPFKTNKAINRSMNAFSGTLESIFGFGFGAKWKNIRRNLLAFTAAIAILVLSITQLTRLDSGKMWEAVVVLAVLAVVITGMLVILNGIAKANDGVRTNPGKGMITAALSLLVLAFAVEKLSKPSPGKLWNAVAVLFVLGVILTAMMVAMNLLSAVRMRNNIGENMGFSLLAMAAGLYLAVLALGKISKLADDPDKLRDSVTYLAAIGAILVGMQILSNIASSFGGGMLKTDWVAIIGMAVVLLIATKALQKVAKIPGENLWPAVGALAAVGAILVAMTGLSKFISGKTLAKADWFSFIGMAAALYLAVLALKEIAEIPSDSLGAATLTLLSVGAILTIMVALSDIVSGITFNSGVDWLPFIAMAAALWIVSKAVENLGDIEPETLKWATISLGVLGIVLAAMSGISQVVSGRTFAKADWVSILAMAVSLWIVASALKKLADVEPSQLDHATTILGLVAGVLIVMLVVTAYLTNMAPNLNMAIPLLVVLGLVIAGIALVLGIMSAITDADKVLPIALSISAVLIALSVAMGICALVGPLASAALPAVGVMALILLGFGLLFGILGALIGDGALKAIDKGIEVIKKVVRGIGEIIGELISSLLFGGLDSTAERLVSFGEIISKLGDMEDLPFDKITGLVGIINEVSGCGLKTAIKNFFSKILNGENSITTFTTALGEIVDALYDWQTKLNEIKTITIPTDAITGLKGIIDSLQYEQGEGETKGWEEAQAGISAVGAFKQDTEDLAAALKSWVDSLDTLKGKIDTLPPVEDIQGITDDISKVLDGLQFEEGEAEERGNNLLLAGVTALGAFEDDTTSLMNAIDSWVSTLDELKGKMKDLPSVDDVDSLISDIQGRIDLLQWESPEEAEERGTTTALAGGISALEAFNSDATNLSEAIATWVTTMDGIVLQKETIPSPDDIQAIVDAIDAVPKESIWTAIGEFFTGKTDMDAFKTNSEKLGEALAAFSTALGDEISPSKMRTATSTAEKLGDLVATLQNTYINNGGGQLTVLGGDLEIFGGNLNTFASSIDDVDALSTVGTAASNIANAASILATIEFSGDMSDTDKVGTLTTNLGTLVPYLTGLAEQDFSGVDRLKAAIDTLNSTDLDVEQKDVNVTEGAKQSASSQGGELTGALASGVTDNASALNSAMTSVTSGAVSAVKDSANLFSNAGIWLVSNLALGMLSNVSAATSAGSTVASSAASGASAEASGSVYSSGINFVQGFANGISDYAFVITAAAKLAVRNAITAAKAVAEEASPSKATYRLGAWFSEGFAIGIKANSRMIVNASRDMAEDAKIGIANAVDVINAMISDDIDASPVITPVLDLSEVQNGAGAISDILGTEPSLRSSAAAISDSMSRMITNVDMLTALNGLQAVLGGAPAGNTYVVNGVTYDDGTNVANAVSSLIRSINVGRRA